MAIVMNSFCQTKIKMGDSEQLTAVVNTEKSTALLPVIDVVEDKGKKSRSEFTRKHIGIKQENPLNLPKFTP